MRTRTTVTAARMRMRRTRRNRRARRPAGARAAVARAARLKGACPAGLRTQRWESLESSAHAIAVLTSTLNLAPCAQVTAASICKALSVGDVIECLWEETAEGVKVYLALIVEIKSRIVRIRWLHEDSEVDDDFIPCPFFTEIVSWELKKVCKPSHERFRSSRTALLTSTLPDRLAQIWDTCSDVSMQVAWKAKLEWRVLQKGQPKRQVVADVEGEAGRWQRASAMDVGADAGRASDVSLWDMVLNGNAPTEHDEWPGDKEEEPLDEGMRLAVVEEPKLTGPAQRKRSSVGYPPSRSQHWYNDAEIANADAVDSRPPMPAGVHVRYNYPRPLYLVPSIFEEQRGERTLNECNCVLIQQFSSGGKAAPFTLLPSPPLIASFDISTGSTLAHAGALRPDAQGLPLGARNARADEDPAARH